MRHRTIVGSIIGTVNLCILAGMFAQALPKPAIEARLTLPSKPIHEDEECSVDVYIENVSDHVILVGRRPTGIANWPFKIYVELEDSSGNRFGADSGAAFVDPVQVPDLSMQDGILRWWIPLEPDTFMGIHRKLRKLPAGKYRVRAKYSSIDYPVWMPRLERELAKSKFPVFHGSIVTDWVPFEVLSKKHTLRE